MTIHDGAKKIVQNLLDEAIKHDTLNYDVIFTYQEVAERLNLGSASFCHVCFQYLLGSNCITLYGERDEPRRATLKAKGIDFLES